MRYAYFPGCSATATGISFTLSAGYVGERIGMELAEIPDWCCCGTSAALVTDGDLAVALPARSLALAERMDPGLTVATPCAGCYSSLKAAVHYARASEKNRRHLEELIEMPYEACADVMSFLEVMALPENREAIASALTSSLHGLKVASYYGCALVRPVEVCAFDDPEDPQSMDGLMAIAGAEPVEWAFKTECCGASHQISEPKAARRLIERIFEDAAACGAEAIATACPLCLLNLDMREQEINTQRAARGAVPFDIPVYYFTELLGIAMGGSMRQLGIDRHFWPAEDTARTAGTEPAEVAAPEAPTPVASAAPAPEAAPAPAAPAASISAAASTFPSLGGGSSARETRSVSSENGPIGPRAARSAGVVSTEAPTSTAPDVGPAPDLIPIPQADREAVAP
ncbi:MAG: CoB--CoM heterodisulfide reductase iron-sulfur subunit B family protein [Coriobacteriales bacterium]|jgi:heterodisulfide reductase subunit B|nr:CoB--CoM heterodisulfide reductase iron-sulfur subunit B family protein [Coriobacteriales bacterium]